MKKTETKKGDTEMKKTEANKGASPQRHDEYTRLLWEDLDFARKANNSSGNSIILAAVSFGLALLSIALSVLALLYL